MYRSYQRSAPPGNVVIVQCEKENSLKGKEEGTVLYERKKKIMTSILLVFQGLFFLASFTEDLIGYSDNIMDSRA